MPGTGDNTFAAAVILTIESDIRGMTIFFTKDDFSRSELRLEVRSPIAQHSSCNTTMASCHRSAMAYICLACSNFLSVVVRISEGAIMFVVV